MVDRQPTLPTATAPVSLGNPADGTPAILLVEEVLVLRGRSVLPVCLAFVVGRRQALAATVGAVNKGRKLSYGLLLSTGLANHLAIVSALVFDPV
jgi:hypothetical protein